VTTRLAGYLFSKLAGIDAVYIPYKGSADIAAAILNGSIQYAVDGVAAHSGLIQGGKVRALAKLNKRPLASMPELKPLDEVANMPQLGEISTWAGIIGPRGLPPQIVERLQKATAGAANDEEVKKKLLDVGIVATSNTPDEFRSYVKTELGKWAAVVRDGGIKFVD
jgi:tripartite-type tricarboxylate transporter receptor subunit TctC